MLSGLIGQKVGMTQFFLESGECVPVSVVKLGPATVVQKKSIEKDGYAAVQIGFQPLNKAKIKKLTKAERNHFKDVAPTKFIKEFRTDEVEKFEINQSLDLSIFQKGQLVDVIGTSKGRGFSGVIKRHNFQGGPGAHGHRFHRTTGSIGASADPSRVFKNKKMPGQYGNSRVTVQCLEVVEVISDKNLILIKGGIPGPNGGVVVVQKSKKAK